LAPPRSAKTGRNVTMIVGAAAIVLVILAVVWGLALGKSGSPPKAKSNQVTVGLIAANGQREQVALSGKKVTVVMFFAIWCPYCAYDAKWVTPEFYREVVKAGGRMFAVDASPQLGQAQAGPLGNPYGGKEGSHLQPPPSQELAMSLQAIKQYKSSFNLPYPLYYDEGQTYAKSVQLQAFPSYIFYNSRGKPVKYLEGLYSQAQLWQTYQQAESD